MREGDLAAGRDDEVVGGDDVVELPVVVDVVAVLPPPLLADRPRPAARPAAGSSFRSKTVTTVGTPTPTRIRAGMIVQPISALTLPWICFGQVVVVVVVTGPELEGDEEAAAEDDDEHDAGDDEHRDDQVVDVAGLRALGLERVLRRVRRRNRPARRASSGTRTRALRSRAVLAPVRVSPMPSAEAKSGRVIGGGPRSLDGAGPVSGTRTPMLALLAALLLVVLLDRAGPRGGA